MQMPPIVTERAFERLAEIGASGQGMGLRVAVEGGGCSGFQYDIKLDQAAADDLVLEGKGEKRDCRSGLAAILTKRDH